MLTLPPLRVHSRDETACNPTMDPHATTQQNDDIDPLELEDQELPDEETVELAHIEDPTIPDADVKVAQEEQELAKEIDKVAVPVEEEAPIKKTGSHIIPKHLIERELTIEDLLDDGAL